MAAIANIGIQRGANTHNHDQVATMPIPANLNTKKIRNTKPQMPIPVPALEFLLIFSVFFG